MGTTAPLNAPRALILETATHLFGVQGYSGTSMRDIANGVGVLPGSLYAHIQSKEKLLVEIVDGGIERFLDGIKPIAASSKPASEKLRDAIKAHVAVVAIGPEWSQVVFHQWRFLKGDDLEKAIDKRNEYAKSFEDIMKQGVEEDIFRADMNIDISVRAVLGALNWTPEWYSPGGKFTSEKMGELMADTLMNGLLNTPS